MCEVPAFVHLPILVLRSTIIDRHCLLQWSAQAPAGITKYVCLGPVVCRYARVQLVMPADRGHHPAHPSIHLHAVACSQPRTPDAAGSACYASAGGGGGGDFWGVRTAVAMPRRWAQLFSRRPPRKKKKEALLQPYSAEGRRLATKAMRMATVQCWRSTCGISVYMYACVPCSYTYVYTLSTSSSHPIALIPDVAVVVPAWWIWMDEADPRSLRSSGFLIERRVLLPLVPHKLPARPETCRVRAFWTAPAWSCSCWPNVLRFCFAWPLDMMVGMAGHSSLLLLLPLFFSDYETLR
jgi:hypothetical protein